MMRRAPRPLFLLSSAALASWAILACGSNGGAGATGGAPNSGGTASGGGAANGGTANGGGSLGGSSTGGGATGGANSGGTSGSGGGSGSGGDGSPSGGSDGDGGSSSGGSSGNQNPIAGTSGYDCGEPSGTVPELTLSRIPGDIQAAVELTHPPDDDRLFVLSLLGDIFIIKDGALLEEPFLSLGNRVTVGGAPGDERGLLGIAFHPDYATNGLFYLHYSAGAGVPNTTAGDSVIEEYKVSSDPDVADPASARIVLTVAQPANGGGFQNHKGGAINFGPDKLLFIGLGDGGGSFDRHGSSPADNAQNTGVLLGKMLRINPLEDGANPYTTPADNLVQATPSAKPEVWDMGLRNPFRTSFDACTGDLYIGDVGQNSYEEVNFEKRGEGRKNYGWNRMEGTHCLEMNGNTGTIVDSCDKTGLTEPLLDYGRSTGQSITGGSVYRGSAIPALKGAYFYADYQSNNVWYTFYDRDANTITPPRSVGQELSTARSIVAIRNGNDGELYLVSLGNIMQDGAGAGIYKLVAAE